MKIRKSQIFQTQTLMMKIIGKLIVLIIFRHSFLMQVKYAQEILSKYNEYHEHCNDGLDITHVSIQKVR